MTSKAFEGVSGLLFGSDPYALVGDSFLIGGYLPENIIQFANLDY